MMLPQDVKQIDNKLMSFKKFRDYIDLLDREVNQQGFLLIDERAYNASIKEFAVKKSELVATLGDTLDEWLNHTSVQAKNYLYDIVKNNNLEISERDKKILAKKEVIYIHAYSQPETEYKINAKYSAQKVHDINATLKNSYHLQGESHLAVQQKAKEAIENSLKTACYQKTCTLVFEKFGNKYNEALFDIQLAIRQKEVEKVGNDFIISSRSLDKPQKIKFSLDENSHLKEIATVAPVIGAINHKFRTSENAVNKHTV